jgi:hypothetical protein
MAILVRAGLVAGFQPTGRVSESLLKGLWAGYVTLDFRSRAG